MFLLQGFFCHPRPTSNDIITIKPTTVPQLASLPLPLEELKVTEDITTQQIKKERFMMMVMMVSEDDGK